MKRPRLLLLIIVFSAMLLSACQSTSTNQVYKGDLALAYAESFTSLNPFSNEARNRRLLINMYEPLVKFDRTFNFKTSLAVGWGRQSDTEWEFRLRKGVKFHDGGEFDSNDAVYSINKALEQGSPLKAQLSTIQSVERVDRYRIKITTTKPDPLLLNRLTLVNIVPDRYSTFEVPIGTGAYRIQQVKDKSLIMERFNDYWGVSAFFPEVEIFVMPSPEERANSLARGDIHFLTNVPPQTTGRLEEEGIQLIDFPSLEVSFLMMNMDGQFEDPRLRDLIWEALDTNYAVTFGGGFLEPTSQYAATGIFGHVSDLTDREPSLDKALEIRESIPGEIVISLDLPVGLQDLATAIEEDLAKVDVGLNINLLPVDEYESKILSGASEFYFYGWKYDLGDAAEFFESTLKTGSAFNGINYSSERLDTLIDEAARTLDEAERRIILHDISAYLNEERVVLPLFESKLLYGLRPEVHWDYRLDGFVFASEIIGNVVE